MGTRGLCRKNAKFACGYDWVTLLYIPQLNQMVHAFVASCCVISGWLSDVSTEITRSPWAHEVSVEKTLNLHVDITERHYFTFPSLTKWSTLSSLHVASFPLDCKILRLISLEAHGHTRFVSKKYLVCMWIWRADVASCCCGLSHFLCIWCSIVQFGRGWAGQAWRTWKIWCLQIVKYSLNWNST